MATARPFGQISMALCHAIDAAPTFNPWRIERIPTGLSDVFRAPDGKFGITVRGNGGFAASRVRVFDVPTGTGPSAVWHTHIPSTTLSKTVDGQILALVMTGFDLDWDEFSFADRTLANDATAVSRKLLRPPDLHLPGDGDAHQAISPRTGRSGEDVDERAAESYVLTMMRPDDVSLPPID